MVAIAYLRIAERAVPEPLASTKPSTVKICATLFALRAMTPDDPDNAPTPFQLLGLDPLSAPFYPPGSSAFPGSCERQKAEGQRAAQKAFVTASNFAATMIINDAARMQYLLRVQPEIESWAGRVRAVDGLCGQVWRDMGWVV
ncbi:hypothetical protein BDP55DRAFT_566748 [Colletotrichum godetiae]|uniref:Uncharacterized protein n=1 Tax=Colletotrichum godetiae TaxID=1209918 RepID=A0AAJ0A6X7_9PEZI|nr:uncharacterized protein BDP55DRAFT_566748 [Colletotrichum godetiae]KAK1657654.1 hypothetical protein BDP55DRAFT_566748 [Colletotrichum godetiae]